MEREGSEYVKCDRPEHVRRSFLSSGYTGVTGCFRETWMTTNSNYASFLTFWYQVRTINLYRVWWDASALKSFCTINILFLINHDCHVAWKIWLTLAVECVRPLWRAYTLAHCGSKPYIVDSSCMQHLPMKSNSSKLNIFWFWENWFCFLRLIRIEYIQGKHSMHLCVLKLLHIEFSFTLWARQCLDFRM